MELQLYIHSNNTTITILSNTVSLKVSFSSESICVYIYLETS